MTDTCPGWTQMNNTLALLSTNKNCEKMPFSKDVITSEQFQLKLRWEVGMEKKKKKKPQMKDTSFQISNSPWRWYSVFDVVRSSWSSVLRPVCLPGAARIVQGRLGRDPSINTSLKASGTRASSMHLFSRADFHPRENPAKSALSLFAAFAEYDSCCPPL